MEKLNTNVVALSLGITTSIVYIVCLFFIAIFPLQAIITISNSLVHGIDISSIATKRITFVGSVIGLIASFLTAAVTGYIFAFVYNWIVEKLS